MLRPPPRVPGRLPLLFAALFLLLLGAPLAAQFPMPAITPPAPSEENADPYGRETPRGCLFGFFRAAQQASYQTAAAYLQIPPSLQGSREAIAHQLQVVFDRRFVTVNMDRISRNPRGNLDDGLSPELERVGEVRGGDGFIDVVLVRREATEGNAAVWLISWETIRQCRLIYDRLRLTDVDHLLPAPLVKTHVGAMPLWQIVAFLVLLVVLFAVSWLLVAAVVGLIHLLRRRRGKGGAVATFTGSARSPATLILTLLLHRVCVNFLGVPVLYRLYYDRVILVLLFAGLFWLLSRIIDAVNRSLVARAVQTTGASRSATLTFARRALKLLAFLVVLVVALAAFGVNLTATLAGLGIGGLALAFAAQKSLENIFGGLAVLAEKALRVGDTCKVGNYLGEVEDITLWATRIRTNERVLVSIPNGIVMASPIENLTARDRFWFHPIVGLSYETRPDQMRGILDGLTKMLAADPRVLDEGSRVRFLALGASSLDVEMFAYVRTPTYPEFLAVQQELLLKTLDVVERAGASIAFPSHTVYLRQDAGGADSPA
jgi:MscS family membrane protein